MKKRIFVFIVFVQMICSFSYAQHIYLLTEEVYNLITLNKNEQVEVREVRESLSRNTRLRDFYLNNDSVFCNNAYSVEDEMKFKAVLCHFPYYLKLKNNNFQVSYHVNDSMSFDSFGRVINVYNKPGKIVRMIKYLTDTTVLEVSKYENDNLIYSSLYELDNNFNLKSWYLRKTASDFNLNEDSLLSINKNHFNVVTFFNYDQSKKNIQNIKIYKIVLDSLELSRSQSFIYKNEKIIKSYIVEELQGNVFYKQYYKYKIKK